MKVTWHPQARIVLNRAKVRAVQTKRLHAPVPAIRDYKGGLLTARIDKQAVRGVEFSVGVTRPPDFSEEFSFGGKSQHVVRAVAIPDIEIAVGSEGDVGGNKIDGTRCIGG